MLKGQEFGNAIRDAIHLKIASGAVRSQAEVARHFGVKPPSVSDWIKKGSIEKGRLHDLWRYFADVAGPAHWGLKPDDWPLGLSSGQPVAAHNVDFSWPFVDIPEDQVRALSPGDLKRLESTLASALAQLSMSVEASDPTALRIGETSRVDHVTDAASCANDHEYFSVPELGVRLAAGTLGIENDTESQVGEMQMRTSLLKSFGLPIERMRIVYGEGDSMEPIIRHRSPMLFYDDPVTDRAQINPRSIYAINQGGRMLVKCIAKSRHFGWVMRSLNPAYPDAPLSDDDGKDVRILGRILWSPYDLRHGVDDRLLAPRSPDKPVG